MEFSMIALYIFRKARFFIVQQKTCVLTRINAHRRRFFVLLDLVIVMSVFGHSVEIRKG